MAFVFQPWQLLLVSLAGWLNREQQAVVEYLRTENQILKEALGRKRIVLNDDQRRRLAVKGKILGRKALLKIATIVTPDTILRWHRQLVAAKGNLGGRRCRRALLRSAVREGLREPLRHRIELALHGTLRRGTKGRGEYKSPRNRAWVGVRFDRFD